MFFWMLRVVPNNAKYIFNSGQAPILEASHQAKSAAECRKIVGKFLMSPTYSHIFIYVCHFFLVVIPLLLT